MAPDRTGWVRGLTRRSFHRIAFADWGPSSAARQVLCVHGLTRNGRDFDHLARFVVRGGHDAQRRETPGGIAVVADHHRPDQHQYAQHRARGHQSPLEKRKTSQLSFEEISRVTQ